MKVPWKVALTKTGVDNDEDTPVPIPNTEVKLMGVDNTWLATAREDRTMPVRKAESTLGNVLFAIFLLSSVGRAHDC